MRHKNGVRRLWLAIFVSLTMGACSKNSEPNMEEAVLFIEQAEARLLSLWIESGRAAWVQNNFITEDTNKLASAASAELMAATTELATAAARFNGLDLPISLQRKLTRLRTSLAAVAPSEASLQQELAEIMTEMESVYGLGEYCPGPEESCLALPALERRFATVRDTDELLNIWQGWREVSPPIRELYRRFVEISNAGARELGFDDLGDLWRSGYDR